MKERYFTIQALEQQSRELYRQVVELSPPKEYSFRPGQSALLVLDMQAYFLDASSHAYIPSAEAIVDGIVKLIKAYSDYERPIIFTQHINTSCQRWNDVKMVEGFTDRSKPTASDHPGNRSIHRHASSKRANMTRSTKHSWTRYYTPEVLPRWYYVG